MVYGSTHIPDSNHMRFFRRPDPRFGTPVDDIMTTLSPPTASSSAITHSACSILHAAGHGRANHLPQGRQTRVSGLTAMVRISATSRMTAITDILFPKNGTAERAHTVCSAHALSARMHGFSPFASHPAAALGIDIIDHSQKACPCRPALARGYLMDLTVGSPRGKRLCGLPAVPAQGDP
jgi:hypothetical protein